MITAKSAENYIKREGFEVPKWAVLEARLFKRFRAATGIGEKIRGILHSLRANLISAVGQLSDGVLWMLKGQSRVMGWLTLKL